MRASRQLALAACMLLAPLALADSVAVQSQSYTLGEMGDSPNQAYVSSPLRAPIVNLRTPAQPGTSPENIFLTYRTTQPGQSSGPLILDNNGSVVWFAPEFGDSMDLHVQSYKGQPVLTFFQGQFNMPGYGNGSYFVMDKSYNVIANIDAVNPVANTSDFHGMVITPDDTALLMSWRLAQADLSSKNGSASGWTWDCVFQEIGLEQNNVLFEWHSLDHVAIDESYFGISDNAGNSSSNPFDYCHINAVQKDDNGDYLVSLRGPSALYSISHTTGQINWRLGGSLTNFTLGTNATFYYQHDPRFDTPITSSPFNLTVFDNAAGGDGNAEPYARGLLLSVDTNAKTATLVQEYAATFGATAGSQGSVQRTSNGNIFVGFGQQPYYTEWTTGGVLLFDVAFASQNSTTQSYRAWKAEWNATPTTQPSFVLNGTVGYVSWNGATDVGSWSLMGGSSATNMTSVSNTTKVAFETPLQVPAGMQLYAVAALASNGTCLGTSEVFAATDSSSTGASGPCPAGGAPQQGSAAASGNTSNSGSNGAVSQLVLRAVLVASVCFGSLILL